jgi:hypothetical protein
MHPCQKGHSHNTHEGRDRCDLKYAEKRMQRLLNKGPIIYKKIVHDPPKKACKGIIEVIVFQEGEVIR